MKVKSRLVGVLVCVTLLVAVRLYAQDQIVAVVNKEAITEKDLYDFAHFLQLQLSRQYQGMELQEKMQELIPGLLEKLIEDRLILQQAQKLNVTVDDSLVKDRVAEIRAGYENEEQFQQDLQTQGVVQADIEKRIREQLMSMRVVEGKIRSSVQVQPDEVTRFYNQNPQEFAPAQERQVDMVTAEKETIAASAASDLRRKITLADIKERYPVTASALTVRQQGDFREDIRDIVFKLKEGEISEPLWLDGKYYVFRLKEISYTKSVPLAEVQDKIFFYLSQLKYQQKLKEWLDELKEKAFIRVME